MPLRRAERQVERHRAAPDPARGSCVASARITSGASSPWRRGRSSPAPHWTAPTGRASPRHRRCANQARKRSSEATSCARTRARSRPVPRSGRAPPRQAARATFGAPSSGPDRMVSRKRAGVTKSAHGEQVRQAWSKAVSNSLAALLAVRSTACPCARRPSRAAAPGPADQRRDEQPGEVEIVERLDREADRGEQVLDRERLRQMEPVDPRDGDALGVQPRDDQAGASSARLRTRIRMSPAHNGRSVEASGAASSSQA